MGMGRWGYIKSKSQTESSSCLPPPYPHMRVIYVLVFGCLLPDIYQKARTKQAKQWRTHNREYRTTVARTRDLGRFFS